MKFFLTLFLACFYTSVFSQENTRNFNLLVGFDSSLHIERNEVIASISKQMDGFKEIAETYGFKLRYAYAFTEEDLTQMEEKAHKVSGSAMAIENMKNVYDVILPNATDEELIGISLQLDRLPKIKYTELIPAKPIQPPVDIPPATPNYISSQTYIGANPGVNMQYAWSMNLNGQGIRIRNIEYGFNKNHEEFHQKEAVFLAPGYTVYSSLTEDFTEHGTATFGIVFGDNGSYGVTGLAHGAEEVILYPEYTEEYGYNRNYATSLALNNSQQGDVIIYEMQTFGVNATDEDPKYVPAEYSMTLWNLTKAASDLGVIVVAAAGNGNQNLDGTEYQSYVNRGDSGAIIVGAGYPDSGHNRYGFSTYGSRVDLQGWGANVVSTGYGDFATIAGDFNQRYTRFGGTSSATPIVASCVAVLQSYYHSLHGTYLSASQMKEVLQITGIPQGNTINPGNIGPLPNMQAAISYIQTLDRNDLDTEPNFNVYPNPFEKEINIIGLDHSNDVLAEIYNASGQKVLRETFSDRILLSAVNLPAGFYFLKLTEKGKTKTYKMIKH